MHDSFTHIDIECLVAVVEEVHDACDEFGCAVGRGREVGHLRSLDIVAALGVQPH